MENEVNKLAAIVRIHHSIGDSLDVEEVASAKQTKKPLSLLIADIDWFKQYNDFHGHPRGDELLRKLVQTGYIAMAAGNLPLRFPIPAR